MKLKIYTVYGQLYVLPNIKVTHTRKLNGSIELIVLWFNCGISLEF